MVMVNALQDSMADHWLERLGFTFEDHVIRVDQLKPGWDSYNPGREQQQIDPDIRKSIAEKVLLSGEFRMPIVERLTGGSGSAIYDIVDGRRRIAGFIDAGASEFRSYVIIAGETHLRRQARESANLVLNGTHPGARHARKTGFGMLDDNATPVEVAFRCNVTEDTVNGWQEMRGVVRVLESHERVVDINNKNGWLRNLSGLHADPDAMVRLYDLCEYAALNPSERTVAIERTMKAQRGIERAGELNLLENEYDTRMGGRKRTPYDNVMAMGKGYMTLLEKHVGEDCFRLMDQLEGFKRLNARIGEKSAEWVKRSSLT